MSQPTAPSNPKPSRGRAGGSQQHRIVSAEGSSHSGDKVPVPKAVVIHENDQPKADSPSHSPHRGSISMGTGRSRVLFCVDDDEIDLDLNDSNDDVQKDEELAGLNPEGDRPDSPANTVNTIDTNDKSITEPADADAALSAVPETATATAEVLTVPLPRRAVRRATKADIKFAHLELAIPQVKLDEALQETIVEKAKDADVWSSESEEEEEKNNTNKTGRNNKFYANAGKKKPSAVKSILQKGKNDKSKKGDNKKDEARAVVVGRAVEELAKLKKHRESSEQQFLKTLQKDIPPAKKMVAHKMTVRIYERVLKKQVDAFLTRGERRQVYLHSLHQRKIEASYEIYVFWKKARIRRYCKFILYAGHLKKLEEFMKQQEEQRAYEERTARRMQFEQGQVRSYLTKLRHTKQEAAKKEQERFTDDQLFAADHEHMRPDLAPFSTHYFNMIQNLAKAATLADHSAYNNQEPDEHALSMKIAERRSQSFLAVLRPEDSYPVIAPPGSPRTASRTSTAATHQQLSLQNTVHTPSHPKSALSPRYSKPNTAGLPTGEGHHDSNAFMQSPQVFLNRGQTPGSSLRGSMLLTPSRGGSISYNLHEEFNSNVGMFSRQVSGIDSSNHANHQVTHTNLSAWWEQLANVDISISQLQQQREVEKVEKISKNKSSAYRALEKLCGLTEDHIRRQNDKYKVKGRKISTSFLHPGLL